MIRTGMTRAFALVAAATVIGASANAVNLTTGSSLPLFGVNSATLPTLTGGTLVASASNAFSSSVWSGTLYTTVIRETTGTLSFLYQVHVDPSTATPDFIARMTTTKFGLFTVDADYLSNSFTGFGFVAPVAISPNPHNADRATNDKIGFDFNNGILDKGLGQGEISSVIYIRTNAVNYTKGLTNFIDGDVANVASFAPTAAVPGPAALIPFGVGLVAAFMRKRRS